MKRLFAIPLLLALAACAPVSSSGSGTTNAGTPITGDRFTYAGFREDVKFSSVEGWSCEGTTSLYDMYEKGHTSTSFPVTCNNGVKGKITMALAHRLRDRLGPGDIHYSFRLDSGVMGQFRI
jgi:hypothetical protein